MPKDLFSNQSALYAKYRPGYPSALIDYILSFVEKKQMAWDCATGNGQAATLYADRFEEVFATDISEKQIAQAVPHPKIIYAQSAAEKTNFEDNSFDLITVAQAYHWLQFDAFHKEATRVGKPRGIVAAWGYGLLNTKEDALDGLIRYFYKEVVGKYWDAERKYVDEAYASIPFHFKRLPVKPFRIDVIWDETDLLGYFNTWSALQHFIQAEGSNPLVDLSKEIKKHWNAPGKKLFSFPVFLLLGKIVKS